MNSEIHLLLSPCAGIKGLCHLAGLHIFLLNDFFSLLFLFYFQVCELLPMCVHHVGSIQLPEYSECQKVASLGLKGEMNGTREMNRALDKDKIYSYPLSYFYMSSMPIIT